jgi:hypothetical protein
MVNRLLNWALLQPVLLFNISSVLRAHGAATAAGADEE